MDVLSRHRLPPPYRYLLAGLWLALPVLLLVALLIGQGMSPALFDPRLLIPLLVMALPALHTWQQGIDVHQDGLTLRLYLPSYHAYTTLADWHVKPTAQGRILWIEGEQTRVSYHAAHLTDLANLLAALEQNVNRTFI